MNKVEYSRGNIFCKKTFYLSNVHGNIKSQGFPKLKLYEESPKVMVNKCLVTNYSTGYKTGQKKASFHFHEDQELQQKWICFVNHKDWLPTTHSVICIDHFEDKFIKRGKGCQLLWCGNCIQYLHFIITRNLICHS